MSWIDKIKTDFVITCGDGTVFTPQYVTSSVSKNINYNISEFVFKDISGTLVRRGKPRGTQYDMEIKFVGEDNIDIAGQFEKSAANSNPWTISHPFYDNLYVQPVSLLFDNSVLNVTTIKGVIIETILQSGVQPKIKSANTKVISDATAVTELLTAAIVPTISTPTPSFLDQLSENVLKIYAKIIGGINSIQDNINVYTDLYNAYNAELNKIVFDAEKIVSAAQAVIFAPANFIMSVKGRILLLKSQLQVLYSNVTNILSLYNTPSIQLKKLYENNAGTCIAGMCVSAVTNITTDYAYRPDVLSIIADIVGEYNSYLTNLDALQSVNGSGVDSYIPDQSAITNLSFLVNYTTSVLFDISIKSKQERILITPYDTNVILLAFQFYGMAQDDSTITTLINDNNIGLDGNEILIIEKGRQIKYYV